MNFLPLPPSIEQLTGFMVPTGIIIIMSLLAAILSTFPYKHYQVFGVWKGQLIITTLIWGVIGFSVLGIFLFSSDELPASMCHLYEALTVLYIVVALVRVRIEMSLNPQIKRINSYLNLIAGSLSVVFVITLLLVLVASSNGSWLASVIAVVITIVGAGIAAGLSWFVSWLSMR